MLKWKKNGVKKLTSSFTWTILFWNRIKRDLGKYGFQHERLLLSKKN